MRYLPAATGSLGQVKVHRHQLLAIEGSLGDHAAAGIHHVGPAPEDQPALGATRFTKTT